MLTKNVFINTGGITWEILKAASVFTRNCKVYVTQNNVASFEPFYLARFEPYSGKEPVQSKGVYV